MRNMQGAGEKQKVPVCFILPLALRLPFFRGGLPFRGRRETFSTGLSGGTSFPEYIHLLTF